MSGAVSPTFLAHIRANARIELETHRPASTTRTYRSAVTNYRTFCESHGYAPVIRDDQVEHWVYELYGGPLAAATCRTLVNGLGDYRKFLNARGECLDSRHPYSIQSVATYLRTKQYNEQAELQRGNTLANQYKLALTMEKQEDVTRACLNQGIWSIVLRFDAVLQLALAARNHDCRSMLLRHMVVHHFPQPQPGVYDRRHDTIGPHALTATIYNSSDSKHLNQGFDHRSAVRYNDPTHCPISATTDILVYEFTKPGRLCKEEVASAYVMRCQSTRCSGRQPVGASSLLPKMKKVLIDAEVIPADNRGKNTHVFKGGSVQHHLESGCSFSDTARRAGHARSVTEDSYVWSSDSPTMHLTAGYGRDFRRNHWLGRGTVTPSTELLELAWPGLNDFAQTLESDPKLDHVAHVLLYHRLVFLQDAALKLGSLGWGGAWSQHFPHMVDVLACKDWPEFQKEVEAQHQHSLRMLEQSATDSCGSISGALVASAIEEGIKAGLATVGQDIASAQAIQNATLKRLESALGHRDEESAEPVSKRQRVLEQCQALGEGMSPQLPQDPLKAIQPQGLCQEKPKAPRFRWVLSSFGTVAAAYAQYKMIEGAPKKHWVKGEGKNYCQEFGRFRDGLCVELKTRAVEVLDSERNEQFGGSLTVQNGFYLRKNKTSRRDT